MQAWPFFWTPHQVPGDTQVVETAGQEFRRYYRG
jgi:hypothetical protein